MGHVDLGAEGLEALGVQVEAARADGVAAGDRDVRLADARDEGSEDADGRPQRAHQLVVGPVPDALGDVDLDDTGRRPQSTSQPSRRSSSAMIVTSAIAGTLVRVVGRRPAARRPSA